MRFTDLKTGDLVGLQFDLGRRIDFATIQYAGSTCYQLSNGLLYGRGDGECLQGKIGGRIIWADEEAVAQANRFSAGVN
jgi:hypothetical protein